MKTRIATQDWYEDENEKTGWSGYGWLWEDDGRPVRETKWELDVVLTYDKYNNPIKARFKMDDHNYAELKKGKGIHSSSPAEIIQIKDNHIAIGGTVYEMERVPQDVAKSFDSDHTPVLIFKGMSFHGKAVPNAAPVAPKRAWEILIFRYTDSSLTNGFVEATLRSNGKYLSGGENLPGHFTLIEMFIKDHFKIHKVKRLEDGAVYTIGDHIFDGEITGFGYNEHHEQIQVHLKTGTGEKKIDIEKVATTNEQAPSKPFYMITAFRSTNNMHVYVQGKINPTMYVWEFKDGCNSMYYHELIFNKDFHIFSAKNIHGNEIEVDQYYTWKYKGPKPVNFKVDRLYLDGTSLYANTSIGENTRIDDLVPGRPIYHTEDQVPVYEERYDSEFFVVFTKNGFGYTPWQIVLGSSRRRDSWDDSVKIFADKEKAEGYVKHNKPSLSLLQIHEKFFACARSHHDTLLLTKLYDQLKESV